MAISNFKTFLFCTHILIKYLITTFRDDIRIMNRKKIWKGIWNLVAVGFGLIAVYAAIDAKTPPYDIMPFVVWTGLGLLAKGIAEYAYD
jgi:hypothetical protein